MANTTATKKLAEEEGVSVWEAEWWLDANAFLDKYPRGEPLRLHCPFILHRMFSHAVAHDLGIHWGQHKPSPEWDLGAGPSTMDLIGPGMPQAEIRVIYSNVYQLRRSPRRSPCDKETWERICQEILDFIKECLWHRQVSEHLEEGLKQSPTGTSKTDAEAEFHTRACITYNHFKNMWWDSCTKVLAEAREAHHQALAAVALLKENIKWLSHSVTQWWSGSCQCLGSHRCSGSHRRSQATGCQKQVPSPVSHNGDSVKRHAQLPSPTQPRWQVTFAESSPERDLAVQELPPSTSITENTSD